MKRICVALVGDFSVKIHTLVALNDAIEHCRKHLDFLLETTWVPTTWLPRDGFDKTLYQGCWVVPGSPYKDDEAVLNIIKWARENDFPLLGTCGGFQYMILEYARNVLKIANAIHEEINPDATNPIILKLACSLKGRQEEVNIEEDSWLRRVLGSEKIMGHFYCSYGFNDIYRHEFKDPFCFTATSVEGEVRACELKKHRFFNGTLFQPSLDSTEDQPNPLIMDFFRTVAG